MCGILGVVRSRRRPVDPARLRAMCESLAHRGPDDEGYLFADTASEEVRIYGGAATPDSVYQHATPYCPAEPLAPEAIDPRFSVALGHRRLSIIDVSPGGHQPICSEDGKLWMVYNGEVYNFQSIRSELEAAGHHFASGSDSEVVLHAYQEWGSECLGHFNGMFSLAILDLRKGRLFCARDRFGIKPFYYAMNDEGFFFASEIKALLASGRVGATPNLPIVHTYLCGATDDIRETFFEEILPLQPGHFLVVDLEARSHSIERWYELPFGSNAIDVRGEDPTRGFFERLRDSVRHRLISDVPVGTCLSGGLDSSSIACMVDALMRDNGVKISGNGMQSTFSARYDDPRHDEGEWIDAVVRSTGSRAHSVFPSGQALLDELDEFIWHHEEPFGGLSIYAQWSVFKLVKASKDAGVVVTLDGQGGDEILGGYHRYFATYLANLLRRGRIADVRRELADCERLHGYGKAALLRQAAAVLVPPGLKNVLRSTVSTPAHPDWMDAGFAARLARDPGVVARNTEYYHWESGNVFDGDLYRSILYGIPRLLRHGDRSSMAHSIESRVPFLDHHLVEFCFAIPDEQKIHHGSTKVVLREAMKGILPEAVRTRHSKLGFSTPQDEWLRHELYPSVDELVGSPSFADRGFFEPARVREELERHRRGEINIAVDIWKWVNVEIWMRRFVDGHTVETG